MRGNSITHAGQYDATWDGMCMTLSGNFATQTMNNSYATVISGYKKCLNACPTQGTVTFTNLSNTLTITYSGGKQANAGGKRRRSRPSTCSARASFRHAASASASPKCLRIRAPTWLGASLARRCAARANPAPSVERLFSSSRS